MENNNKINLFFKLIPTMYFILMIYSFVCLFFGLGSERYPFGFHFFLGMIKGWDLSYTHESLYAVIVVFWAFFSIYYLVYFIINLTRFCKNFSKKLTIERKLVFLKRMQQNILRNVILLIGFAFMLSSYTKEISLFVILLIILLYIVFFVGYVLERLSITGEEQKKIETKRIIMAILVNFLILIMPLFLLLINIQFNYAYVFSFGYNYYDISIRYLQKSWYVLQFFEYLFLVVLCLKLFQTATIPTLYQIDKSSNYTIAITIFSFLIILIQSVMTFGKSNFGKFVIEFSKNQLPTIILLIALNLIDGLQDKSDAVYPLIGRKERKKRYQEELRRDYYRRNEQDDFTGFKF